MSEPTETSERAFVLGLDGVPWRLIERWTESGDLPNFARMREEGAAGPLESTHPPTTSLAWPSIATGVWPDKHGIYGFQKFLPSYTHRMNTSRDRSQPTLWELFSPALVGNVPMTYPASEIDGTLATGMLTPSVEQEFTHPPAFADEIRDRIPDYQISLDYPEFADRLDEFPAAVDELLEKRRELLDLLMERRDDWRLFFFVFVAPDRFQHLVWDEQKLLEHYRKLDAILGDVIDYTDDHGADLYVVSDHGFGPVDEIVHVNYFLEREGYLVRRDETGTRSLLGRLGLSRDAVLSGLNRAGITEERLVSALPRQLVDSVAEQFPGSHSLYDVDYTQTKAFVHDAGNCYINDTERFDSGVVSPAQVPAVKAELIELFEGITDEDGERLFRVFDGDELFPTDEDSPDLIVNAVHGYESRNAIADEPFADPGITVASHRSEGIMLCRGPTIDAGVTLEDASVVDVAPTVLHGCNQPVPSNVDGRALFEAFRDGSLPSRRNVEYDDVARENGEDEASEDDFDEVTDRLKGLGYLE
ncbi:alkaline phosphatase family protein [Natrialbaceae archaeon A-arb3/5]